MTGKLCKSGAVVQSADPGTRDGGAAQGSQCYQSGLGSYHQALFKLYVGR